MNHEDASVFNLCVVGWVAAGLWAIARGHIRSLEDALICIAIGSASFTLALIFKKSFEAKWAFRCAPFLVLLWYGR